MLRLQHCCSVLCLIVFSFLVIVRKESYCSPNARKPLATNIIGRITRNVNFDPFEGGDCEGQHKRQYPAQTQVRDYPIDHRSDEMHVESSGIQSTANDRQCNIICKNCYPGVKNGDVNVNIVIPILQMPQVTCPPHQVLTMVNRATTPTHTLPTTTHTSACPKYWIHVNDKCYFFSFEMAPWHGAQIICKRINSELAHPIRHSNLKTLLQNYDKKRRNWWIGGTDAGHEGKWVWTHDRSPFTYTHWASGQPSNLTTKNCLYLKGDQDYMWADEACNTDLKFICQKSPYKTFLNDYAYF